MRKWTIIATVRRTDYDAPPYTLTFEHLPVTIGASVENDIVLDAPHVSSFHAHVTMTRGTLLINNRSRNGTFLGGKRVEQSPIHADDLVQIQPFDLRFRLLTEADTGGTIVAERTPDLAPQPAEPAPVPPPAARATGAKTWTIEIVRGPEAVIGKTFQVPRSGLRIGRSPTADLTIDTPTLSRLHVDIRMAGADDWEAVDLQSRNGTFVNGARIESVRLRGGDEIALGDEVAMRFDRAEERSPAAPIPQPRLRPSTGFEDPISGATALRRPSPPAAPAPPPPSPPARPAPPDAAPGSSPLQSPRKPLQIRSRRAGWNRKVLIVALEGWLDGYNYTELGNALDRVADNGERCVLLDVTQLAYTDHTGLGVIMKAITAIERYGGTIRIVGATQRLRENISLARLDVLLKGKMLADESAAEKELKNFA